MNVDFTGVEEAVAKFDSYLTPGVYELTITGTEFGESNNGKTYVDITCVAQEGKHVSRFFLTAAALGRLMHLMINCGVPEKTLSGMLTSAQIEKLLVGKKFRGLLGGEERMKNGSKVVYTGFGYTGFAQPLSATPFVFNENKHISKLKSVEGGTSASSDLNSMDAPVTSDVNGDMPF